MKSSSLLYWVAIDFIEVLLVLSDLLPWRLRWHIFASRGMYARDFCWLQTDLLRSSYLKAALVMYSLEINWNSIHLQTLDYKISCLNWRSLEDFAIFINIRHIDISINSDADEKSVQLPAPFTGKPNLQGADRILYSLASLSNMENQYLKDCSCNGVDLNLYLGKYCRTRCLSQH